MLLIKFTLSFTVVFSCVLSYLMAPDITFNLLSVLLLLIGGMLITGSANAINQMTAKDTDALMKRTAKRPVASGRMRVSEASAFAAITAIAGTLIIGYWFNWTSALLGLFSLFLYGFIYTPLKKVHSVSVLVGAVPGALPCLIGWVAATGHFGIEAGTLFIIQFFWQFPHFWAIGWFLYDDYKKAGCFMLPTGERDKKTALQTILYTIWMILASIIPAFGFTGNLFLSKVAAVIVVLLGLWMLFYAVQLHKKMDAQAARKLMIVSVSYISLLQIVYVIDKFLR